MSSEGGLNYVKLDRYLLSAGGHCIGVRVLWAGGHVCPGSTVPCVALCVAFHCQPALQAGERAQCYPAFVEDRLQVKGAPDGAPFLPVLRRQNAGNQAASRSISLISFSAACRARPYFSCSLP